MACCLFSIVQLLLRYSLNFAIEFQTQRDPRLNEILFPFANRDKIKALIDTFEPNNEYREKGKS